MHHIEPAYAQFIAPPAATQMQPIIDVVIDEATAMAICCVEGVRVAGRRLGNWLNKGVG